MRTHSLIAASALALALPLWLAATAGAAPGAATTIAVIGDTPYGADQTSPTALPGLISSINGDPDVSLAVHLGDIKNGSTQCTDSYFSTIKSRFDTFADPLVYTPGDNEWTDCHRANNGGFIPTERLAAIRSLFFPTVGQTIGGSRSVSSQATDPAYATFKENVRWEDSGVVFATVHVVGSNDDTVPWFTQTGQVRPAGGPGSVADQNAEVSARQAAELAWVDAVFDRATAISAPGVFLGMQADMWDPAATRAGLTAFDAIVEKIGQRAQAFAKPVLLLEGDSHLYQVDNPYSASAPAAQRALHPASTVVAPNLTRVIVQGQQTTEWLKVVVDPASPAVFSFTRQPVTPVTPVPAVPEAPVPLLLPLSTLAAAALVVSVRQRRTAAPAQLAPTLSVDSC